MDPHPVDSEPNDTLLGWAMREIAPWHLTPPSYSDALRVFEELNTSSETIAVYRFSGGKVTIEPKPDSVQFSEGNGLRAHDYLTFFRTIALVLPEHFNTTICVNIVDEHLEERGVPIFCFQKKRGASGPLLPDIDFIMHDFYARPEFIDRISYRGKRASAVFSGATTGGPISPDVARNLSTPRLRAAGFFVGNERVDFRLPSIVQYSSPEAQSYLAAQPFCRKPRMSWREQLENRFILSMDGNGATCSRIVIALLSNSLLLKYDSEDLLYYFAGMQPWLHYVPIAADNGVEEVMDLESLYPERFERIAANGREFALTYLSKASVESYMAMLLQLYAETFVDTQRQNRAAPSIDEFCEAVAHIQGHGDTRSGSDGWVGIRNSGCTIEGFSLSLTGHLLAGLSYQVLSATGELSEPAKPGRYCGTRGKNESILGLSVSVDTGFAAYFYVTYEARFVDGSRSGPVFPSTMCRAASRSPLEAFRIRVTSIPRLFD